MSITVYEKPTCSTCKKLHTLLTERGVDFETVDYHVAPLSESEIRDLLTKAGITPHQALRTREPGAAGAAELDEDGLIAAMAANPALLQRPIVVNGDRAVLARPVARALEVL